MKTKNSKKRAFNIDIENTPIWKIEASIKALEFAMEKAKNKYPIQGKINQYKKVLQERKKFEFLAK